MENTRKIERKTLFLYPNTDKLKKREDRLRVMDLIADVSKIVLKSNDEIKKILMNGCFAFIRCRPSVSLKCVTSYFNKDYDCNDVRICITRYCNQDYSTYYEKIVDEYRNKRADISHLVAIRIVEDIKYVRFLEDSDGNFSAIVETGLDNLDLVLESIMMDIALYHYFGLDTTLEKRRSFNKVKSEYIYNHFNDESRKLYSLRSDSPCEMYLPFSFPHINQYNIQGGNEIKKNVITSLIQEFGYFVLQSSKQFQYNSNAALSINESSRDTDRIHEIISENSTAKDLICSKKSFILFFFEPDSAKNSHHLMLELTKEISLSGWLEAISEDYKISFFLLCPKKED